MSEPLLIAIFGLLSAGLGGLIHALFQRWQAKGDHLRNQKIETYSAYFNGVAQLSHASNQDEISKAHAIIAEARGKIALYGSPEVIEAMTEAFRCGPIRNEDLKTHSRMIRAMRNDLDLAGGHPSENDLFEMLFGAKER